MNHGELDVCVTSGYRITTDWRTPTSSLEAEAIVYGTGGVTFARFTLGAGGSYSQTQQMLRDRVEARARAWIAADAQTRARMQRLDHASYWARSQFWRRFLARSA